MQIKTEERSGITVCALKGDVDISSSPEVKKEFDNIIGRKANKLVVNLSDVKYVDSSGLATMVEVLKNMRKYGGTLHLCNLSDKIKGLFEITKLDKLFKIAASEEEAIKNLS